MGSAVCPEKLGKWKPGGTSYGKNLRLKHQSITDCKMEPGI